MGGGLVNRMLTIISFVETTFMAKVTRDQLLNSIFTDPKNYPYGFARSGDFSITESKALSHYGRLIWALTNGKIAASCPEDDALLAAANGEKPSETPAERAWEKYQMRINRPKAGSIYGKTKSSGSGAQRGSDDTEIIEDTDDVIIAEEE